jgi:hypothetical protein
MAKFPTASGVKISASLFFAHCWRVASIGAAEGSKFNCALRLFRRGRTLNLRAVFRFPEVTRAAFAPSSAWHKEGKNTYVHEPPGNTFGPSRTSRGRNNEKWLGREACAIPMRAVGKSEMNTRILLINRLTHQIEVHNLSAKAAKFALAAALFHTLELAATAMN